MKQCNMWTIPEHIIRFYAEEPNAAITHFRRIPLFIKKTYYTYLGKAEYDAAKDLLLDSASIYDDGNTYTPPTNGGNTCNNVPELIVAQTGDRVGFSVNLDNVNSSNAVSIQTKLDGSNTWANYLGSPVDTAGEVFVRVTYSDGCPESILHYSYELDGSSVQIGTGTSTPTASGDVNGYIAGSIVNQNGVYYKALVSTSEMPQQSRDWAPIIFDVTQPEGVVQQRILDDAMGGLIATRIARAALPAAKAPLVGGKLKGSGSMSEDGATNNDYRIRLDGFDEASALYIDELKNIAVELGKKDWPIYPNSHNCEDGEVVDFGTKNNAFPKVY